MIKYFQALTVYLLFLVMTACGGSSSDSDKTAAVELITVFELIAQQEVFLDTLAEETDFSSTPINIGETKESETHFSIIRSTSINQITWLGVIDSSLPGEIKTPQFKINIYQDNNGAPNIDAVITISEVSQVKKMAVLNDKQTVYAFNINKSSLFDLAPNHYYISISLIADEDYTFFPLLNNESSVQQIRLAGSCVGPCKLDQVGSDEDDVLIGDEFSNHFKGNKGNDILIGGNGDDFYYFERGDGKNIVSEFDSEFGLPRPEPGADNAEGTGNDSIVFMPGIEVDQLDFVIEGLNLKITIYDTEDEITLTDWFLDDSTKIEFLSFSILGRYDIRYQGFSESASYLSDWIGGDERSNTMYGLEGKDILSGRQGDDFLYGGDGDDLLIGGSGADVLDGGAGLDTISYHDSSEGISIYLDNSLPSLGGTAQGDSFDSIESILATKFDDVIHTNAFTSIVHSYGGNDVIVSMSGGDKIFAGDGDDVISAGSGRNYIFGQGGNDEITTERSTDIISGGHGDDLLSGGESRDVYLFSKGFGNDKVVELESRRYSDDIVLSGYALEDIWFYTENDSLIIEDLHSLSKIELLNYSNFNIVFDTSNEFLSIEQDLTKNELSILTSDTTIFRMNYRDLESVIEEMDKYDRAVATDDFPLSVLELYKNKIYEINAGKIITENKTNNSFGFQMNEDEILYDEFSVKENNGDKDFSYKVVKNSDYGNIEIDDDGSFVFTPIENFSGHSIIYIEFEDELGFLNRFRVVFTVKAVDDLGSIESDISIVTMEEEDIAIDIGFKDSDNILGDYIKDVSSNLGHFIFDSNVGFIFKPYNNAYGKENVILKLTDRLGRVLESNISIHVIGVNDSPT
jgi:Ca2+-binding RTX toxin-like protein